VPFSEDAWRGVNPKGVYPSIQEQKSGITDSSLNLAELMEDKTFERIVKFSVLCNSGEFTAEDKGRPCLERLCCNGNASDYAFLKMAEAIPKVASLRSTYDVHFGIDATRMQVIQIHECETLTQALIININIEFVLLFLFFSFYAFLSTRRPMGRSQIYPLIPNTSLCRVSVSWKKGIRL